MRSLVLFNNKGGVGKTTLTFNLAHMFSRLGLRVAAMDCDPQCNLSAIFLNEDELLGIWQSDEDNRTVADCVDLVRRGKGDVRAPKLTQAGDRLWLLPGKLALSRFEQTLAEEWAKKSDANNERALDVTTALDVLSNQVASACNADLIMIDIGPNLGALNRAALLSCDSVVVPLAPDLFSLQGLENVGPTLREWRQEWLKVRSDSMKDRPQSSLPPHDFRPVGYIVQQHLARSDRPVAGYGHWAAAIPRVFHGSVLDESAPYPEDVSKDDKCLALMKHFASLVPIAQQARKPLFDLKKADGIGGGQLQSVANCRSQFEALAKGLLKRLDVKLLAA